MIGRVGTGFLIAVIIGMVLLAIVISLVYVVWRGGSWDCVKCKTQFTTWCYTCYKIYKESNMDVWTGGNKLGNDLYECVRDCSYWPSASGANQDCVNAKDPCKPFILYTE